MRSSKRALPGIEGDDVVLPGLHGDVLPHARRNRVRHDAVGEEGVDGHRVRLASRFIVCTKL